MLSNCETNFYIRRDNDELLWSGISVAVPNIKYNNYKLSCFIKKGNNDIWSAQQIELIIFDRLNNMYRIDNYNLSQLYNKKAKNKEVQFIANFSKLSDDYANVESTEIFINELLLKNIIDEFRAKAEQSFGAKIKI